MQRTLLTLALIAMAGIAQAQTTAQTMPAPDSRAQAVPSAEPRDPYGRPLVGRNDWVRQPGDRQGPSASNPSMNREVGTNEAAAPMPAQSGPRQSTFKDEFGFRYDAQGNRLDGRGNIISPQTR